MAFFEFKNVRIAGMSAGVPKRRLCNLDIKDISADYDAATYVEATGVMERRVDEQLTTSDLCVPAAERLLTDLGWEKDEVEGLIFVSQTADYYLPATACIIQDRLGLSKTCYAMDVALGCSGWVYGLSSLAALMAQGGIRKALLMAGDAKRRVALHDPLFGFAGSVTALEYQEGVSGFKFCFGTDGSGFDAIIIPDGGSRNGVSVDSFKKEMVEGRNYSRLETRMKGMDVFSFGIMTAPESIKKLAKQFEFDYLEADCGKVQKASALIRLLCTSSGQSEDERHDHPATEVTPREISFMYVSLREYLLCLHPFDNGHPTERSPEDAAYQVDLLWLWRGIVVGYCGV